MNRRPPRSIPTYTLGPYATLFRSPAGPDLFGGALSRVPHQPAARARPSRDGRRSDRRRPIDAHASRYAARPDAQEPVERAFGLRAGDGRAITGGGSGRDEWTRACVNEPAASAKGARLAQRGSTRYNATVWRG